MARQGEAFARVAINSLCMGFVSLDCGAERQRAAAVLMPRLGPPCGVRPARLIFEPVTPLPKVRTVP